MNDEQIIQYLVACPMFTLDQKKALAEAFVSADAKSLKKAYELMEKHLQEYDTILNEAYLMVVDYKDKLSKEGKKERKKAVKAAEKILGEGADARADEILKDLD